MTFSTHPRLRDGASARSQTAFSLFARLARRAPVAAPRSGRSGR